MILYSIIIVIGFILIAGINLLFHPGNEPWYYYLYWTAIFTIGALLVDAVVAILIRRLPEDYFTPENKFFQTSKKEMIFYRKIGINKWKDKVPELGQFTGFRKNEFTSPNDPKYLERFILESCYGVAIHFWSAPASFIILLLDYRIFLGTTNYIFLTIGLPVAIVNAILIFLPYMVLKNNLYRLNNIYSSLKRKQTLDSACC